MSTSIRVGSDLGDGLESHSYRLPRENVTVSQLRGA